jgi:SAM-dependent methyltransferase
MSAIRGLVPAIFYNSGARTTAVSLAEATRFALLDTQDLRLRHSYWLQNLLNGERDQRIFLSRSAGPCCRAKSYVLRRQVQCGVPETTFPNDTFDLVLQSTVFTSVLDSSMKQQIASEMLRVVKRDGFILWYDYHVNNPWNTDVQGVKRQEISQLFPGCLIKLQRITLAPPLVRLLAPYSWLACYLLGKVPWLCTHYLGVIWKE